MAAQILREKKGRVAAISVLCVSICLCVCVLLGVFLLADIWLPNTECPLSFHLAFFTARKSNLRMNPGSCSSDEPSD